MTEQWEKEMKLYIVKYVFMLWSTQTRTQIYICTYIYMHMYRTYTHIYSGGKFHHRSGKFKANGIVSQRILKDCKNKKYHNKE